MIELFEYAFMQKALLAGIMLGALLAFLGVFITLKKMAFFGDGIAHASLAGIAIGLLADLNPLPVALVFAVLIALGIYFLENKTKLSSDTIIGIFFTGSMALGVLLMHFKAGYQPELISFLFGNILAIQTMELWSIFIFSVLIIAYLIIFFKKNTLLTFDEELAYVSGINVARMEITLYIALAIAIVLGVKILGIVLVSALLIIPPATAKLLARTFKGVVGASILISECTVLLGIIFSYVYNVPTGATIVLAGTGLFILTLILNPLLRGR